MAFTRQDRTALAQARRTVEQIGAKEQEAIDEAADVCRRAGLVLQPGCSRHEVILHADAVRDALEPFDSGMREAAPADARG